MTQEEKQLLLKDLCARIPYRTFVCLNPGAYNKPEKCLLTGIDDEEVYLNVDSDPFKINNIRPYLRPMSSMTEEEKDEYDRLVMCNASWVVDDWLNKNHFDYRGLIEMGLALEATERMYKSMTREEKNLFRDAKFGDKFLTRNGQVMIYQKQAREDVHCLFDEESDFAIEYRPNGDVIYEYTGNAEPQEDDIIKRYVQPSISTDLDEAAEENYPDFSNDIASKAAVDAVRDAFRTGAEWQKEQTKSKGGKQMKAPDKIYIDDLAVVNNCVTKISLKGLPNFSEYIRKDALLEWVKEHKRVIETHGDERNAHLQGEYSVLNALIDKLNLM